MTISTFVTRRVKPSDQPKNTQILSLGSQEAEPEEVLFTPHKQYWEPNFVLNEKDPCLRLNKLQSHIGQIKITTPEAVLWQAEDKFEFMIGKGTLFNADTLKRPVLKFTQGALYITLKFFDQVDRIYIGSRSPENFQIQLNSGKMLEAETGKGMNALVMYKLSTGEIELRCEIINSTDLVNIFGLHNLS